MVWHALYVVFPTILGAAFHVWHIGLVKKDSLYFVLPSDGPTGGAFGSRGVPFRPPAGHRPTRAIASTQTEWYLAKEWYCLSAKRRAWYFC